MESVERNKRNQQLNDYLGSLSDEELLSRNNQQLDQDEKDFNELKESLSKDMCSYCGYSISHFSDKKPCFHWLLKPNGFKKRHFPLLYGIKSYHQLEAYVRWVANTADPIKNINDVTEDNSSNKILESTIKYKNLEWSFSCTKNDFAGHPGRHEGQFPHYHFQMKYNGNVVINYNGFHVPFHDYDFFCFDIKNGTFDKIKAKHIHGAGIQTLMNNFTPEELLNLAVKSDEANSNIRMQTLITADEGTTISGDDLADLFEESKRTGIPVAKLIQRLSNVSGTTYITPGPAVPEIPQRTPHRKKRIQEPLD